MPRGFPHPLDNSRPLPKGEVKHPPLPPGEAARNRAVRVFCRELTGANGFVDCFENAFRIFKHFMIPESQDTYSLLGKKRAAILIMLPRFGGIVLSAV